MSACFLLEYSGDVFPEKTLSVNQTSSVPELEAANPAILGNDFQSADGGPFPEPRSTPKNFSPASSVADSCGRAFCNMAFWPAAEASMVDKPGRQIPL